MIIDIRHIIFFSFRVSNSDSNAHLLKDEGGIPSINFDILSEVGFGRYQLQQMLIIFIVISSDAAQVELGIAILYLFIL